MRISDWSSDVCSSDLPCVPPYRFSAGKGRDRQKRGSQAERGSMAGTCERHVLELAGAGDEEEDTRNDQRRAGFCDNHGGRHTRFRSEEHTSELQSLMRISYAVFCLKKKTQNNNTTVITQTQTPHIQNNNENTYIKQTN